jgi:molecular chaperone DnaK (HSP70)
MEKESAREEEHIDEPSAENESKAVTAGDDSLDAVGLAPEEVPGIDIIEDEPPFEAREEGTGSALERSIGIGLPSDRYRVILPKGSFPPLNGRQQFIARLRDRDRVSFRIFQGDEELASENEFLAEVGMVGIALNNEEKAFLEVDFHLNLDRILRIRLQDKFGEKESYIVLDMTRKRKASIKEDNMGDLMRKLESIEQKVGELSHGIRGGAGGAKK